MKFRIVEVVREGLEMDLPVSNVVVGDLVVISAGDKVPADVRIIESSGLKVSAAFIHIKASQLYQTFFPL